MKTPKLTREQWIALREVVEETMEEIITLPETLKRETVFTCNKIQGRLRDDYIDFEYDLIDDILEWYSDIFTLNGETIGTKLRKFDNTPDVVVEDANELRVYILAVFHAIICNKINKKACGF